MSGEVRAYKLLTNALSCQAPGTLLVPGGTEPLSEQLVMETTVCSCSEGTLPKAPRGTRRTELDSVQGTGIGKLRQQIQVNPFHRSEQK